MMQIKQNAPPRRYVAILPLRGSTAAFRHPCPTIPGTARDDGLGSGGNMRFSVQTTIFPLIWPKIADKFWIEYIQEIIQNRDNPVDKFYPEFIHVLGGTLDK